MLGILLELIFRGPDIAKAENFILVRVDLADADGIFAYDLAIQVFVMAQRVECRGLRIFFVDCA